MNRFKRFAPESNVKYCQKSPIFKDHRKPVTYSLALKVAFCVAYYSINLLGQCNQFLPNIANLKYYNIKNGNNWWQ